MKRSAVLLSMCVFIASCVNEEVTDGSDQVQDQIAGKTEKADESVNMEKDLFDYISEVSIRKGVGLIYGNISQHNLHARTPGLTPTSRVPLFDSSQTYEIGRIPLVSDNVYTYRAYITTGADTVYYFTCDHDRPDGMFSIENSLYVAGKTREHYNLFACRYGKGSVWARRSDIDSVLTFISWEEYFKEHPDGNDGWKHGYNWIGNPGPPLLAGPDESSRIIGKVEGRSEIYLTGEFTGNFARVVIKPVSYNFGEMYFESADYGPELSGWLRIMSPEGYPLIEEVILGC